MNREQMLLYAVTDRSWSNSRTLMEQIEQALQGGVTMVQLREKDISEEAFIKEAIEVKKLCDKYQVPLIINDNVEVAQRSGADGVHVGQKDMRADEVRRRLGPGKIVGVSARTVEQAKEAEQCGADYIGSGAVFHTGTKTDAEDLDHAVLQQICESISIPVVGIGGISIENAMLLKGKKIAGIAVVSALFAQQDIKGAAKELKLIAKEITVN